ncbi:MAG TPA: amidohydrolase family protein [Alphaproteobacteria bacterium]|nr:amidohydrolase family protein [Alphaproteobacteria bacterium]
MTKQTRAAEIRRSLGHPVVDSDGHYIETMPILKPYLVESVRELAGKDLADKVAAGAAGMDYDDTVLRPWSQLNDAQRRANWISRPPWWSLPAANTLDRATSHLPKLMAERLDEMGLDFAVMYPSRMLTATAIADTELRRATCRSLNRFYAEAYKPYADRMTPVAQIPTHTPQEGIEELEYAVKALGYKAIMINGLIHRPLTNTQAGANGKVNWGSTGTSRIDVLGIDSEYDYDPFWAKCIELKVVPASHTPGMGWGSRQSPSSYMYNHIGSFGAAMEATCKGLFIGGVTKRFPQLAFGLLEGGVGWACTLLNDIIEHWEKRNSKTIHDLDPAAIDLDLMMQLFQKYGDGTFRADAAGLRDSFAKLEPPPPYTDEWAATGIGSKDDIVRQFVPHFYFGCEADDKSVAWAFNSKLNPRRSRIRAMFSSDAGHWDVTDVTEILPEAYELVEHGHITERDFRDFVFGFPVQFYATLNRDFFKGTRIEKEAAAELAGVEKLDPVTGRAAA